ncbi:MobH family relaxase [Klebsiella sp. CN_Kp091]|uniref:MobH family relaxase n=1 Tax=unclassified Klebsiella TaxID=2608929 RepID=UPI0032B453C0
MSIISSLFMKIRVALFGGPDYEIVYDTDDEYDIPHTPNKDVQNYLDYPSKPTGITLYSEREILSVHANRLQEINMYIGLPNSDLSDEAYTFTNLIIKPLMEFTRWIHLLPASENHHHAGTGGLLTHSLETAFLALKFAYSTELSPIGLQDEEQVRKRRYLYAAFICGLLHDAGKIFDVDVISSTPGVNSTWRPLSASLMDWANTNRIMSYEVIWRKRTANDHSVRAPVFLERCLNDTCLNYLSDVVKERMYDKMLASLGNYTTSDDFISRCMRTADWHSTGTDTSYRYDKQSGIRASDTAARAISIIKDNISALNINGFDSSPTLAGQNGPSPVHIMIIGGAVYINEHTALDYILNQFKKLGVNFPDGEIGRKSLTDLLVNGGYIEPYGEQRIAHFFHRGEFTEMDIQRMFSDGIKGLSWYSLLKIKWVGFLFKYDVIPENLPGIFSINDTNDYVYVDRKGNDTIYTRPISMGIKSIRLGNGNLTDEPVTPDDAPQPDSKPAEQSENAQEMAVSIDQDNSVSDEENGTNPQVSSEKVETQQKENKQKNTRKKQKKKEAITKEEYITRLQHQFNNNAITPSEMALIDGLLHVSDSYIRSIAPLDDTQLMESDLFTLSLRIGSINEEFSVPANDGKRYTQLSNEVSLIQLRHQPDVKTVEMLPLLSSDLFGGVTPDETASEFNLSVLKTDVYSEPLPPERYEKELSVATDNQFEPSDIPPSEYPDIQTDDAGQSWGDYDMYSQDDSAIQMSGELPDVSTDIHGAGELTKIRHLIESVPGNSTDSTVVDAADEQEQEGFSEINRGFEELFARQDHIITDPAIVITENIEEAELLTLPTDEVAGATDSDTLQSDIDTIITLLNKIRLNNSSITVRQLLLTVVVTDINFCLRLRITEDIASWGFDQDELAKLRSAFSQFPIAKVKVGIGRPIRHYMIRLKDIQQGAQRNNIFYDEFIAFFNHQEEGL